MRFLLTPPGGTRPGLVVDTYPEAPDAKEEAIDNLRTDMHGFGCHHGILFDREHCRILRDTYTSMDKSSIIVEPGALRTQDVLGQTSDPLLPLDRRIEHWLKLLSTNWNVALPTTPETATPFITDIVPAASGSIVHGLKHRGMR